MLKFIFLLFLSSFCIISINNQEENVAIIDIQFLEEKEIEKPIYFKVFFNSSSFDPKSLRIKNIAYTTGANCTKDLIDDNFCLCNKAFNDYGNYTMQYLWTYTSEYEFVFLDSQIEIVNIKPDTIMLPYYINKTFYIELNDTNYNLDKFEFYDLKNPNADLRNSLICTKSENNDYIIECIFDFKTINQNILVYYGEYNKHKTIDITFSDKITNFKIINQQPLMKLSQVEIQFNTEYILFDQRVAVHKPNSYIVTKLNNNSCNKSMESKNTIICDIKFSVYGEYYAYYFYDNESIYPFNFTE